MSNENKLDQITAKQSVLYFVQLVLKPLLFLAAGVLLLVVLGFAQRVGWIQSATSNSENETAIDAQADYICPMMCQAPTRKPGKCSVCAMELVPATSQAGGDERSIFVDAVTRRVANIQTDQVRRISASRSIRAVGEVHYDESRMKTIAAYTDGRFEKMYIDFTGAFVNQGDRLASFYSRDLYSAQVEFVQAINATEKRNSAGTINQVNRRLLQSSRQRLVEFGMTDSQIQDLQKSRKAQSRVDIVAPMRGTVIERLAVEGEYVRGTQPIFRLADLSKVWLKLQLFPEDAASVEAGQSVEVILKSLPHEPRSGRVAFIDPTISDQRTVSVRVELDNLDGRVRVGDYATALIDIPLSLADDQALVISRTAVLSAGENDLVYVETSPGRFEIRRVLVGPSAGADIVILQGLAEGESVAAKGNFLIDSAMQLAGNPSLIDPTRAEAPSEMIAGFSNKETAEIKQLADEDQTTVIDQVICPVTDAKLGSMGRPLKVDIAGKAVFICCEGCRNSLLKAPDMYLAKLRNYKANLAVPPATDDFSAEEDTNFDVPEIGEIELIDDSVPPIGEIKLLQE